jgi:hypothetical protein
MVLLCRLKIYRLKLAEAALKQEVPSANVRPFIVDLSSFAVVRKAAAEVNAYPEPLHVCQIYCFFDSVRIISRS